MTSLADLLAAGAFVPDAPIEKEIRFQLEPDGDEIVATIFVRKMSIGDQERLVEKGEAEERSHYALSISELVTLGDGTERITFQDAYKLHPALAAAMMSEINKVNGKAKK